MVLSVVLCATLAGFGADTPGGRGGRIIRVTTLDAAGPGSLREALETKAPRIVVFEVGGVIDLDGGTLAVTEPFLTVAGQTAPSPGITIVRGGLRIMTHDVVMRHIRVRPGDAGRPKRSGWEPEVTTSGPRAYNIVIDHCSFSWAVDENLSVSGPRHDGPEGTSRLITLSNNIIAEGLRDSSHSKGPHSMGTLVHDSCNRIAIIGNLYAHNNNRNPYFKAFTTGVVMNNLIYNPGARAVAVDYNESEWEGTGIRPRNARIAVVGNVFVPGADTRPGMPLVQRRGDVYLEDNIAPLVAAADVTVLKEKPVWPEGVVALPAAKVTESVLRNAGARPRDRDEVDRRIVREFRERKGRIIDSQEEVGGYPKPTPVRRKLAIPKDVDAWLAKMGSG